jgi:6-phosphogluconolactonase
MTPEPTRLVLPTPRAVADAAAAHLLLRIDEVLARDPEAQLALTGGSLGSALWRSVLDDPRSELIDWSRVRVWWGDERWLPPGDPDRNDTQNDAAGLERLGLDPAMVHRVLGPDQVSTAEESAAAYAATIKAHGKGSWDVVLLGMGPDGHIASLFPRHPAQRVTDALTVAVHDSPKPPPTRVSLTFECLERTQSVLLLVAGAEKADAVAAAHRPGVTGWDVPASVPRGSRETVWFLDMAAAGP